MNESKAKFVKLCNAENIKNVRSVLAAHSSPCIDSARKIIDSICKFVLNDQARGKDSSVNFTKNGDDIFESPETYSKLIKECDPTDHDRVWLQEVANSVNMDAEGKKGTILH